MKSLVRAESVALFLLGVAGLYFQSLHVAPWLWPLLILAPDLSMLGYLAGPRIGAVCYNLAHHQGIALAVAAAGFFLHAPALLLAGVLLFTHSAMDRMFGYGLKHPDHFKHTHLGWLPQGKHKQENS